MQSFDHCHSVISFISSFFLIVTSSFFHIQHKQRVNIAHCGVDNLVAKRWELMLSLRRKQIQGVWGSAEQSIDDDDDDYAADEDDTPKGRR